jgi:uncharacterized membrane protein YgdD (TMEM256/DUF423 family)
MKRPFFLAASVLGFFSIALGAFATHALKNVISASGLVVFELAVRYQMYHALALLGVALVPPANQSRWLTWAGWLWVGGTLIFSVSLYLLAITGWTTLGAITPVGGMLLLAGWLCLIVSAFKGQD